MNVVPEKLTEWGLTPSTDPRYVFDSPLIRAADAIRALYRNLPYDHRPELPPRDRDYPYLMNEWFRVGYACFKYAVAAITRPRTICEIGVGAGTGALAFLAAAPTAHYFGIDDGSKQSQDNWPFLDYVASRMHAYGYSHEIVVADSMKLDRIPRVDLVHVDGNHLFEYALNDTRLALESGSEWVLVDDARDFSVSAGAMVAVREYRAKAAIEIDWAYFEDTWTGSILVRRRHV